MIKHEARDMPNRFWAKERTTRSRGAWTDNNQVCVPLSRVVDDFALGAPLSLHRFRAWEIALSFLKDLPCSFLFCLLYLLTSWCSEFVRPEKTFSLAFHLLMWPGVDNVKQCDCESIGIY